MKILRVNLLHMYFTEQVLPLLLNARRVLLSLPLPPPPPPPLTLTLSLTLTLTLSLTLSLQRQARAADVGHTVPEQAQRALSTAARYQA